MSKQHKATVVRTATVAQDTSEVLLDISGDFTFTPGQYITITLPQLHKLPLLEQFRDMSISSAPSDEYVAVTFRNSDSEFKKTLLRLGSDDEIDIQGPAGIFAVDTSKNSVAVAGGIGITPFVSQIKHGAHFKTMYYNTTPERAAYTKLLKERLGNDLVTLYKQPEQKDIQNICDDPTKIHWYIAGPPRMVHHFRTLLKTLMVSDIMITTEEFAGYDKIRKN